jgi:hypothetical protein
MDGYVRLPHFNERRERKLFLRSLAVLHSRGLWDGKKKLRAQYEDIETKIQEHFGEVNQKMIQVLRMSPDQRSEWWKSERERKWKAYVESRLEEEEKEARKKTALLEEDVLRGIAARFNKIASPAGGGTSELNLQDIELPADTSEGRMYADAEQSFEEAKERIIEHTRHVIHLHADLLIIDQVLKHARPLLDLVEEGIARQKVKRPPAWIKEAATEDQEKALLITHELLDSKESAFSSRKDLEEQINDIESLDIGTESPDIDGGTVIRHVQRLGKKIIALMRDDDPSGLPKHYLGHENGHFKRLVRDLWSGDVTEGS